MKFLEEMKVEARFAKAKLKYNAVTDRRTATLEFGIVLTPDILAGLPKSITSAYGTMLGPEAVTRADLGLVPPSQNVEIRNIDSRKTPNVKLPAAVLDDLRLESDGEKVMLYYSVTSPLFKDILEFLDHFGAQVWVTLQECQQDLVAAMNAPDDKKGAKVN